MLKQITAAASVAALMVLWSLAAVALPSPASLLPGFGCVDAAAGTVLLERIAKAPNLIGFVLGILPGIILLIILC